jgi:hypothetical protein
VVVRIPVRSDLSVNDSMYKRVEIEFRALLTDDAQEEVCFEQVVIR